ncbi:MAG: UDP-glucose 4-epimerase GalE [Planctomycetota bacterium]
MNILVTGGCGYIGSATARLLQQSGHEVFVVDDFSEGHAAAWDGPVAEFDLRDGAAVHAFAAKHSFDGIVHFAARAYIGESVGAPLRYWHANLVPVIHLCEAFPEVPFVFSSTCATYGEPDVDLLSESLEPRPVNPYGATKLAAERLLSDRSNAGQGRYVALRYFNAAGAEADGVHGEHHEPEPHLIPRAVLSAMGVLQEEMAVFGMDWPTPDGTCVRDYIHIEDLADAHVRALESLFAGGPSDVFNLGTGRGYSVLEVLQAVEAATGKKVPWKPADRRPGDPARLVADPAKAHEVLGWQATRSDLDSIVASAVRWHTAYPNGYPS